MKVTNTSTQDPLVTLATTMGQGGIERQEARGQEELVASSQLPTDGLVAVAKELGITMLRPSEDDDIFSDVELPDGWELKPTEHSMWSDLVDETGKKRASVFYKAAHYDRSAHIQLA